MAVDPNIKKKADDIRNKIYGKEVRESLASGLETMSSDVIENEGRQDSVESQWQNVVDETTGKDVISAPEIIAARDGEEDLKARLDKENQEVTAQLAQNGKLKTSTSLSTVKSDGALISFVDDDGSREILNKLVPLSQEYNVPFTVCMPSDFMLESNGLNTDELKDLQDNYNFEIASHGKTHAPINNDMPKEEQFVEVFESWETMRRQGLNIETFVYPYGQSTDYARQIVSRYYKSGVSTDTRLNGSPLNTYRLGRHDIKGRTLEECKGLVDEALSKGQWLIWLMHVGQDGHDVGVMRGLVEYIQSLNIDIVNVSEGIDRFGNAIDINEQDYYIASDGKNNIVNTIPVAIDSQTGEEKLTADTLPSELEEGKIYFGDVYRSSETQKMPTQNRGVLYALKSPEGFSREWYIANSRTYTRNGISDETGWTGWNRVWETSEIEVTADFGTVEPGEVSRNVFNDNQFSTGTSVIVTPQQTFHGHLMFSYHISGGGQLMINLFNPTETGREVGEITFKVNVLARS